ncbi:MAG: hypothetical protein AB1414_10325 [bacterium]
MEVFDLLENNKVIEEGSNRHWISEQWGYHYDKHLNTPLIASSCLLKEEISKRIANNYKNEPVDILFSHNSLNDLLGDPIATAIQMLHRERKITRYSPKTIGNNKIEFLNVVIFHDEFDTGNEIRQLIDLVNERMGKIVGIKVILWCDTCPLDLIPSDYFVKTNGRVWYNNIEVKFLDRFRDKHKYKATDCPCCKQYPPKSVKPTPWH